MSTKKIVILLSLIITIVFFLGKLYLASNEPKQLLKKESSTEDDFLVFSEKKKKLSHIKEKVFLLKQFSYYWDDKYSDYRGEIMDIKTESIKEYNHNKITTQDVDNNNINETYKLEEGRLTIIENQSIIWQSPKDWWIDNFILADSNNDQIIDINLSIWKVGSFGSSKPFWIEENDMSIKNHFFVLDYLNGEISQIWASSNLTKPNCDFLISDIDSDGKNDLIVIEGEYTQELECVAKHVALWKWNDWGFSNHWRSKIGNYTNLRVEEIDKKSYIIVNSY